MISFIEQERPIVSLSKKTSTQITLLEKCSVQKGLKREIKEKKEEEKEEKKETSHYSNPAMKAVMDGYSTANNTWYSLVRAVLHILQIYR